MFLPSPAGVSRAPHLNIISTKLTRLSSRFRRARTRVYVQRVLTLTNVVIAPRVFAVLSRFCLSYCQNVTHVHTENRGEPLKVLSMSSATVQRIPEYMEIRGWTSGITLCNIHAYGLCQSHLSSGSSDAPGFLFPISDLTLWAQSSGAQKLHR